MTSHESRIQKAAAKRHSARKAEPKSLDSALEKRLFAYALAAGAGMALTSSASAEIVYTPVYRAICGFASIAIDLNNDGITDFALYSTFYTNGVSQGSFGAFNGNKVIAAPYRFFAFGSTYEPGPVPLRSGFLIGPTDKFVARGGFMWLGIYGNDLRGPWLGKNGRYLGLEFQKDGRGRFGWARISVGEHGCMALTGYAYETIPGKPITAGQTQDTSSDEDENNPGGASLNLPSPVDPRPASLGMLALGFQGVPMWRRKESKQGPRIDT
jgi:hypothetical protein